LGIGALAGIFLPLRGGDTQVALRILDDLLLSIGTYLLIPLMFAQVSLSTADLFIDKSGRSFISRSLGMLLGTSLFFAMIGGLAVMILPIDRIPINLQESNLKDVPTLVELLKNLVSPNALQLLTGSISAIPGIFLFSLVLGFGLHLQRNNAKPVFDLLESITRVLQCLNRYVVEILIFGSAVMLAARIVTVRETPDIELFLRLFLIIFIFGIIITFGIYPLVLRLLGIKQKPFAWFKHIPTSLVIGLCSGNNFLPVNAQIKNGVDDLRYPRPIWGWYYPIASLIGRAGTAMVTAVSFFLVLRSYSSLEITILQFLFVVFASLVLSIIPNGRILVGLALLSAWFGQGIEEGFLILQPVTPLLISVAVLIDVLNQSFVAYVLNQIARQEGQGRKNSESHKFMDDFNIS
jgi:Na+/H+-dicarboxylate symporter